MKDFRDEFYRIITLVENHEPMALVRYGDGEHLLMEGKGVSNITQAYVVDKWRADQKKYKLSHDLEESLLHTEQNYYYGIPCQCCNDYGKKLYLSKIKQPDLNITFANIFINGNYNLWKNFLFSMGQHIVLIANEDGIDRKMSPPLYVDHFFPVKNDCAEFWETNRDTYINYLIDHFKNIKGYLVFVSAGPMAKAIIHFLYQSNPTNRYIDVGSSIDEYIHGRTTRPYMVPGNPYNQRICIF